MTMSILAQLAQTTQYYYSYNEPLSSDEVAMGTTALMVMLIAMLILGVVLYVVVGLTLSRIFKKAGVEGWKAWVPVYNSWTLLELGGQQGFWAILSIIPFVNIVGAVFLIIAMYHIGLKFGKDGAFVLLGIFLPIVWMAWLAFDKSVWNGGTPVAYGAPGAVAQPNGAYAAPVQPAAPAYQPPVEQPTPQNDQNTPQSPAV